MTAARKIVGILLMAGLLCMAIGCGNETTSSDLGVSLTNSVSATASSFATSSTSSSTSSTVSAVSQSPSSVIKVNESSSLNSSKQILPSSSTQSSKVPPAVSVSSTVTSHHSVRMILKKSTQNNVKIDVTIPQFSGFPSSDALNDKIQKIVEEGIAEVKDASKYTGATEESLFFGSNYNYSENGAILSVWLTNNEYAGGAHPNTYIRSFTVNTITGDFYTTLGSLFQDEVAGKNEVTNLIIKKLTDQSELDSDMYLSTVSNIKIKNGNYQFYVDKSNLIIYFDPYDILPYAFGIPTFSLDLTKMQSKIRN